LNRQKWDPTPFKVRSANIPSSFSILARILDFINLHPPREKLIRNKMATLAPYVVPALTKHTATVIMAHGLGDRYVSKTRTSEINSMS
jgi:hypothetical protein